MVNFQNSMAIGLLVVSLLALFSLIRGNRTTQTLSLIQLFLILYVLIAWNMVGGYLSDFSQLLANPTSFPTLIACFVISAIGLFVFLRKRPLG